MAVDTSPEGRLADRARVEQESNLRHQRDARSTGPALAMPALAVRRPGSGCYLRVQSRATATYHRLPMRDIDLDHATRVIAIIPVGMLDGAKSRLGAVLDAEERRELARQLADTTIRAAVAAPGIAETFVVTPDDEVRGLALDAGARPLRQRSRGLNAGLREAREEAVAASADAILVLPTDLPNVSPDLLAPLIEMANDSPGPLVVIIPDRHDRGTNALLLAPPDVIDFRFGGDSKDAHIEAGRAVPESRVVVLHGPLTLDLDTPDDLLLAQAHAATGTGGGGG